MPAEPTTSQVICIKWGSKYGPHYVNRLYGMVSRHLTPPFRLVCFTDDQAGIRSEVECLPIPELGCAYPSGTAGRWRKVVLWSSELGDLRGPALFVDLDSVIVGSLDGYFAHGSPDDVVLARNWARPLKRLGQTSVFRFPVGRHAYMLEDFRADPQGTAERFRYEQHYVSASIRGGIGFWPDPWTRHFRLHCLPLFPLRYFLKARIPKNARIVTFPGGLNPEYAASGRWNARSPDHPTLWSHLAATFTEDRVAKGRWEHLKRFLRPCDWIERHWRD